MKRLAINSLFTLATLPMLIGQAYAGPGWGDSFNITGAPIKVPTFYANSPSGLRPDPLGGTVPIDTGTPLRKFVDTLPGLGPAGANNLGQYLPIAVPEKWVDGNGNVSNDDYYEIAAVEHAEQMHSDFANPSRSRGYVQLSTAQHPGKHVQLFYPNGTPVLDPLGNPVFAQDDPHYLGPLIISQRGVAVRIKFSNYLPVNTIASPFMGDMPIPVDETIPGSGPTADVYAAGTVDPKTGLPAAGLPIKYTQNRISVHLHGTDAPWISDGEPHQWFAPAAEIAAYASGIGKGPGAINVPDMPDPGPGNMTFYYPNNMSARLMWYHDHASGITRLNAYMGLAAGYLIQDAQEADLMARGVIPPMADMKALIVQDKTFVPKDVAQQDSMWNGPNWGRESDFWFCHVYEVNQDPNSIDGTNPVGRWDWGPWFWPVFPSQFSLPSGAYGDVTLTPEMFADTALVNGTAYPTMTVDPKPYRFRMLNGSNDRSLNFGFYLADPTLLPTDPGYGKELKMVPAGMPTDPVLAAAWPANWPVDGRAGGVPDPATAGPDIVVIGTEGGFLPEPVVIPSQPIVFEMNRRSVTVLNVLQYGLYIATAERYDFIVDFSKFAGKTLILYNDSPAPVPASDPRYDYFTGDPDNSAAGGARSTMPGFGPNTRTFMQVKVNAVATTPVTPFSLAALQADLPVAYAQSQPRPIIPEAAYNVAFGTTDVNTYGKISAGSYMDPTLDVTRAGVQTITGVIVKGSGGSGYSTTTPPQIVFNGGGGTGATAVANVPGVQNIRGLTITNGGSGYLVAPLVTITSSNAVVPGVAATALATITNGVVTGLQLTNPGADFTAPPIVTIAPPPVAVAPAVAGVTATATATMVSTTTGPVTSITLTSPGTGYTSAPSITFVPVPGTFGTGAAAAVVSTNTVKYPVHSKAIQELFDPVYGRMNATLGVEMPMLIPGMQTTIPLNYVDPATEHFSEGMANNLTGVQFDTGETQIWKIVHNGVDTHPVHFHFYNLQVVNRVGWDGTIKPTPPEELGWKETVKMNPLEDIVVAIRTKRNDIPFAVPQSIRLMDPSLPVGSTLGFTQLNPFTNTLALVANALVNYDNEYVWHCHILGHEENDFMRPVIYNPIVLIPDAPSGLTVDTSGTLRWGDPTPFNGFDAAGAPTLANVKNEIGFIIQRADVVGGVTGAFVEIARGLANKTSWVDTTVVANASYAYQVFAYNVSGNSLPSNVATGSGVSLPQAPSNLQATAVTSGSVTLGWVDNAINEAGFEVFRDGKLISVLAANSRTFVDAGVLPVTTYSYEVKAYNALGSVTSGPLAVTTAIAIPAAPTRLRISSVTDTNVTLLWNDNANNETSYEIWRNGVKLATMLPNTTVYVDIFAAQNTAYSYVVKAVNSVAATPSNTVTTTTLYSVPQAPSLLRATSLSSNQVGLAWNDNANNEVNYEVWRDGVLHATLAANVTTYTDSTLVIDKKYTYLVKAVNPAGIATSPGLIVSTFAIATSPVLGGSGVLGNGVAPSLGTATASLTSSSPVTPTNGAHIPDTPTNLSVMGVVVGRGVQAKLEWTDNATNESLYTVERQSGTSGYDCASDGNWTRIATLGSNSTATVDATAVAGAAYCYRVNAVNAMGSSAWLTTPVAVTMPVYVASPTELVATPNAAGNSVALNWVDMSTNDSAHDVYVAMNGGEYTQVTSIPSVGRQGQQISRGMTYTAATKPGNTYGFQVFAVANNHGVISASAPATVQVDVSGPGVPVGASGLTAAVATATTATLTWIDNAKNEASYLVEVSTNGGAYAPFAPVVSTAAEGLATGRTVTYLVPIVAGNTYNYRVTAIATSYGVTLKSGASAPVTLSTMAPAAPDDVKLKPASARSRAVTVSWTDKSRNETGFTIQRSLQARDESWSEWANVGTTPANVTSYTNGGLKTGSSYRYRVMATSPVGNSGYSEHSDSVVAP